MLDLDVAAKRLGILCELVPKSKSIGVLHSEQNNLPGDDLFERLSLQPIPVVVPIGMSRRRALARACPRRTRWQWCTAPRTQQFRRRADLPQIGDRRCSGWCWARGSAGSSCPSGKQVRIWLARAFLTSTPSRSTLLSSTVITRWKSID